jgi:hypothetical protein
VKCIFLVFAWRLSNYFALRETRVVFLQLLQGGNLAANKKMGSIIMKNKKFLVSLIAVLTALSVTPSIFAGCGTPTNGGDDNQTSTEQPSNGTGDNGNDSESYDYLSFELLSDGTYEVTLKDKALLPTEITIPKEYNGKAVTSIGYKAFYECGSLTKVTLPQGLTSIGYAAFAYCDALTDINVPDTVTFMDGGAFYYCSSLTGLTLPEKITSIGYAAFAYCSSLAQFTIPDGITSIGEYAFEECSKLTQITIPAAVTSIGEYAFSYCKSLSSITVAEGNANYKSVDGNLYTKDGTTLIQYAIGNTRTSFTVPNGVTYIENCAILNCDNLTEIVIAGSVKTIGSWAIENCANLTKVTLMDGVQSIDYGVFAYDGKLAEVTLPDSLTSIGEAAFYNCSSIAAITIPKSVETIGDCILWNCDSLTVITVAEGNENFKSVDGDLYSKDGKTLIQYAIGKAQTSFTVPDGVTTIGISALEHSLNLTEIVIPDSVTTIGEWAFLGCEGITELNIPKSVTLIEDHAIANCISLKSINVAEDNENYKSVDGDLYTKDGKTLIQYAIGKAQTIFVVPEEVTTIYKDAFDKSNNLTGIVIASSVTAIGEDAFFDCANLKDIYYNGTYDDWAKIDIDSKNDAISAMVIYYYSATEPTTIGNYWHYAADGATPVVW